MSNAFGSRAPSSGWDLAHQRFWDADQQRMAHLDAQIAKELPSVRKFRNQNGDAQRAWRQRELKANPPAPCVVCGKPKNGWKGKKCRECNNYKRCDRCLTLQAKWRSQCKLCGVRL